MPSSGELVDATIRDSWRTNSAQALIDPRFTLAKDPPQNRARPGGARQPASPPVTLRERDDVPDGWCATPADTGARAADTVPAAAVAGAPFVVVESAAPGAPALARALADAIAARRDPRAARVAVSVVAPRSTSRAPSRLRDLALECEVRGGMMTVCLHKDWPP